MGAALVTNIRGEIELDFYYDPEVNLSVSNLSRRSTVYNTVSGPQQIKLASIDSSSSVDGYITAPYENVEPVVYVPIQAGEGSGGDGGGS